MGKTLFFGYIAVYLIVVAVLGVVLSAPSENQKVSPISFSRNERSKPHRFTIQLRKPKLRTTTTSTETAITNRIKNETLFTTLNLVETTTIGKTTNETSTTARTTAVEATSPWTTNSKATSPWTTTTKAISARPTKLKKLVDLLEISSTEEKHFVAWPLRRRPKSRRFRPPAAPSTTMKPLLKLRKPKASRPAMYSLDGYVPKPSLTFKATTEAPADILAFKMDLQALGSFTRKSKVKFTNDAGDDDLSIRKYKNKEKKNLSRKSSNGRYRTFHRNGLPGIDFPEFDKIPTTTFECADKEKAGTYADPEARCQVWHLCPGGSSQYRHSFLCPNGTVFSERRGVCDWWYNVDC